MKRIQKGTVRGISLKLQEEERERRMDYVPEVSLVDQLIGEGIEVDEEVHNMLQAIGFGNLDNVTKSVQNVAQEKGKNRSRKEKNY